MCTHEVVLCLGARANVCKTCRQCKGSLENCEVQTTVTVTSIFIIKSNTKNNCTYNAI